MRYINVIHLIHLINILKFRVFYSYRSPIVVVAACLLTPQATNQKPFYISLVIRRNYNFIGTTNLYFVTSVINQMACLACFIELLNTWEVVRALSASTLTNSYIRFFVLSQTPACTNHNSMEDTKLSSIW